MQMFLVMVDPEGATQEMLLDERPKLERLIFSIKLENLRALEIDLFTPESPVDFEDVRLFGEADFGSLEKHMPNVCELTLKHCLIDNGFAQRLFDSSLLSQMQTLNFDQSLFQSPFCVGQLLTSNNLSNLKRLGLPLLRGQVQELLEVIQSFQANKCLGNLETLVISNKFVPIEIAAALLLAIGENKSLVKLKSIEGLRVVKKKFPNNVLVALQSCAHLSISKFDFSCIAHLFKG